MFQADTLFGPAMDSYRWKEVTVTRADRHGVLPEKMQE